MSAAPILVYRLGSLGDTVVALPCFHAIERAYPGTRKIAVTNIPISSKAAALEIILGPGGFIDGAIDYPVGSRSVLRLWALRRAIRATGARTMVYLAAPRGRRAALRDMLFFRLCGLRTIVGTPLNDDVQACRETPDGVEPEAERMVRALAALGPIDLADPANWDLRFTPGERARADAALVPLKGCAFLGMNMGGKDASKDWGDANWQALIDRLTQTHGTLGLVAAGAQDDFDRSGAVLARWSGPTANLCGRLSPRESGAALGGAALFIGHDSGPLHLASAGGTQVLGAVRQFQPAAAVASLWRAAPCHSRDSRDGRDLGRAGFGDCARDAGAMTPGVVFLDRDGTIIVEREYLSDPALVTLETGAVAGLTRLVAAGYVLVVLTNQSGIARGYFDQVTAERVNARVAELLMAAGVPIAGWFLCPHGDTEGCDCRKPAPGLAFTAHHALGIGIEGAWIIGDKMSDAGMATAFGGRGILVTTGHGAEAVDAAHAAGVPVVADLDAAADVILGGGR